MKLSVILVQFHLVLLISVLGYCQHQNETFGTINKYSKLIFNESYTYPAVEDNILSIKERFNTTERILGIKLIDESETGFSSQILEGGQFNKYVVFGINSTQEDQNLKFRIEMYNADKEMIESGALRTGCWSMAVLIILASINFII